jgi:biopolymer transport protein ExbB
MKLLLTLTLLMSSLFASELEMAYQKEYAYLIAEKKALSERVSELKKTHDKQLGKVKNEIEALQRRSLGYQNKIDLLNQQIVEASRGSEKQETDSNLLDATILQAKESLHKVDKKLLENDKKEITIKDALALATATLKSDEKINKTTGEFFLADGTITTGDIVEIGRVAKYGISDNKGGLLAPAGNGHFRVWEKEGISTAKAVANNQATGNLDIFLFESATKPIEKKEAKTYEDDLKAGGLVGYVIVGLGIFGILLVVIRAIFLMMSGSSTKSLRAQISKKVDEGDIKGSIEICKTKNNAASNVMASTLRNLDKDREHIEDIISESILHESSKIDRFGSLILVIAAISPLLGLLGTVTGMISTFDIITEFGTGDPKMLSGGISEALVTTKFGLIVAIPLILLGNTLSNWAERIKDDMEQSALHIINKYKK